MQARAPLPLMDPTSRPFLPCAHTRADWILNKSVQKLVIVISSIDTKEALERWQFDLQVEGALKEDGSVVDRRIGPAPLRVSWSGPQRVRGCGTACRPIRLRTLVTPSAKTEKEIHNEVAAIIRQITASVTFLPLLDQACACPAGATGGARRRMLTPESIHHSRFAAMVGASHRLL